MIEAALRWASSGWPIFPCSPWTKRPLIRPDYDQNGKSIRGTGWPKKATVEAALIKEWWSKWPNAMIGLPLGGGGVDGGAYANANIFVVDLDIPKDTQDPAKDRDCLYEFLSETLGGLPKTRTAITASGGVHLYFALPGERSLKVGNRARLIKSLNLLGRHGVCGEIDVRGAGGYVIAPPSKRFDGRYYEWLDTSTPIQNAPEALIELVARGEAERNQSAALNVEKKTENQKNRKPDKQNTVIVTSDGGGPSRERQESTIARYVKTAVDAEISDLSSCAAGGRNHQLNKAAFSLGTLIGAGLYTESAATQNLIAACEANGLLKDDGHDVCEATIMSGLASGCEKPRDMSNVAQRVGVPLHGKARATKRPAPPDDYYSSFYTSFEEPAHERAEGAIGDDVDLVDESGGDEDDEDGDDEDGDDEGGDDESGDDESAVAETIGRLFADCQGDFSVEKMNENWALCLVGSQAVVIFEQPFGPIEDRVRLLKEGAFHAWFANRFTPVQQKDGKWKEITWSKSWWQSQERRQYIGLQFKPSCDYKKKTINQSGGEPTVGLRYRPPKTTPGYYNLWRGFAYEPVYKKGSYDTLKNHILNNVCRCNADHYQWLFASIAHMFQRPRERIGTALVFRGKQGVGKSTLGEVVGALLPAHYYQVDDPRYITGNFNAHMAACLLLQAEEAVWAGDKTAEGRLKGLITSKYQMIEAKGIDAIRVKNYVRVWMTSNEAWVVPANKVDRRFAVFDVGEGKLQNHAFFEMLWDELYNGGFEALLYDLLTFDLSKVDVRTTPKTNALLEQKIRSLDSVEAWWFERLWAGDITTQRDEWPTQIDKQTLYKDYVRHSDDVGVRRRREPSQFSREISELCPAITSLRVRTEDSYGAPVRKRMWVLPSLEICRCAFESAVDQSVEWPGDEGNMPPPRQVIGDFDDLEDDDL